MISGKGIHMYKGGGGVALLILSHFSLISHENEMISQQAMTAMISFS